MVRLLNANFLSTISCTVGLKVMYAMVVLLSTSSYDTKEEIDRFTDEMFQPENMRAGLGEDGKPRTGSLTESADRNDRCVAHAMLLCANRRGVNMLIKKRPDLIGVNILYTYLLHEVCIFPLCVCIEPCLYTVPCFAQFFTNIRPAHDYSVCIATVNWAIEQLR